MLVYQILMILDVIGNGIEGVPFRFFNSFSRPDFGIRLDAV